MADTHENYLYDVPAKLAKPKMPEEASDPNDETNDSGRQQRGGVVKSSPGLWQIIFKLIELVSKLKVFQFCGRKFNIFWLTIMLPHC